MASAVDHGRVRPHQGHSVSSESKSTTEGSLMPPPRLTRRRSPRRPQSPEQTSSNTIDFSSGKLRKELPGSESKRPGESLSKTRQSAPARSPVAETISKPSTSAASNKRRSGVVKEVEKLQVARDRRRAAAVVEQDARNKDPSNPNWEFQQMTDDFKEDLDLQPLQDGDPISNNRITVCIRKRPLSAN